jgi:hypothetical protein
MYNRTGIITPIIGSIGITVISHGIPPPYRAVLIVVPVDRRQRPVIVAQRQGRPYVDSCVGRMSVHMG